MAEILKPGNLSKTFPLAPFDSATSMPILLLNRLYRRIGITVVEPTNENENVEQEAPNPFAAFEKKIAELEAQVKEKEAKYLYLYAEFDNFKKRSIKERSDLLKYGWETPARELLQVVDNLERALAHTPENSDKNWVKGIEMVLNQLKGTLEKQGIQVIETLEKLFDPHLHEAVGQEPSNLPSGTIVKEHARGYTLHGRLLRPACVIISSGQATNG